MLTVNKLGVTLSEPGPSESSEETAAEYCLNLPGKTLYLTHLLALKKFRKRGNKDGALRAFQSLDKEGLGKLVQVGSSKGSHSSTTVSCHTQQVVDFFLLLSILNSSRKQFQKQRKKKQLLPKNYLSLTCPCQGIATF